MSHTKVRFLEKMEKEGRELVCQSGSCNLRSLVVNLFINFRLHSMLRENNRSYAAASGRKNRKLLKFQNR